MTILQAQADSNERGLCHCGQRATSELSYAEEMDQRQNASSLSVPPSSPPTDQSYRTPPVELATMLIPVPEEVQLPSPTSEEEVLIPIPPPHATVMDMVIFRTIFFELFSFLHVHTPYLPFRLLTNLGNTPKTRQKHCIRMADNNGTKFTNTCYCYLGAPSWNPTPPPSHPPPPARE